MNRKVLVLILLAITLLGVSCTSTKKIVYLQGIEEAELEKKMNEHIIKIKPDDNLYITVNSVNPDAAQLFNSLNTGYGSVNNEALNISGYIVDQEGYIYFPVLGKVKLEGMSKAEAAEYMREKISEYVVDPTVNIRYLNFKVTVLGEVARPGTFTIKDERVTILEALGMAGDMTIYGKRKNVLIFREADGVKMYERLDLTSPDILTSDFYYLQQNDVVYVQPNKARAGSSTYNQNLSLGVSFLSLLVTILAVLI